MTGGKLHAAELIGVSRSYAYRVIRKLNGELAASGHYVVPDRVDSTYLEQKYFGALRRVLRRRGGGLDARV